MLGKIFHLWVGIIQVSKGCTKSAFKKYIHIFSFAVWGFPLKSRAALNRRDPDNFLVLNLVGIYNCFLQHVYPCDSSCIKRLEFSLKYEKINFPKKNIISWKILKFLWSDWKQYRNSLRPFLVIFQTTFEKSWKIILKIYFFDKMTKNTFFSIISIRFPMDTYPGLFLCSSLSVSEIIGIAPVKGIFWNIKSAKWNRIALLKN